MIPAISLSGVVTNITAISVSIAPKPQKPLKQTLKSLANSGKLDEAIRLIEDSPSKFVDTEAYSTLLHACISQKSLKHGQRLYLQLRHRRDRDKNRHNNLLSDSTLQSKFITLFAVCGRVHEARCIFDDGLEYGDVPESVWVAMAIGYARNGYFMEALLVYGDMLYHFIQPGNFAFSVALKACADLNDFQVGRGIHAQVAKSNEEPDQVVNNALLRFYAECGRFDEVVKVFEEMPERNIVSWNSLITSLLKQGRLFEAMDMFRRMQRDGMGFSWVTLTTILSLCAQVTALHSGKEIHAQIVKSVKRPDMPVLNSLLDMYGKCGVIDYCRKVFDGMSDKDLTSWNTLLTGFAMNGHMEEAMELFNKMVEYGLRVDEVTFIALLSGCSHAGRTDAGQTLFNRMKKDFGVSPSVEHYACLVDTLGRAGRIDEALEIVKSMPMQPSGSIWGSLLNSCRLYGKVSHARTVAKHLFQLEPNNPGNYVMLSNIYANAGLWEDVNVVREMMQSEGLKKEAGCSWIHIKNSVHTFVAGGSNEFRNSAEYKKIWSKVMEAMDEIGYVADTGVVLHDVNDEMKAMWVCGHSERLATMFALIHTAGGMPIRITKNLRVCRDCHAWMKIVSRVMGRIIVLRDTNRFHHFKEGECTCKDYW
ncbi:pentatricopeptide repeat-containing protein [Tripterygium wilfordii]|uniref:Pentatricopeptide repeat-containing protein n=1 Tax=Tripterygium wilfordii TaxID=458696 RepID=A0A7J7DJY1_TRIWF|nr:pentatricopeptide repeat-containing protein At3g14330 [Tripterygium wilfordii]KAF5746637.1 pentatricopeptide repeat-containing protein [Tripterygium wilfordii]